MEMSYIFTGPLKDDAAPKKTKYFLLLKAEAGSNTNINV